MSVFWRRNKSKGVQSITFEVGKVNESCKNRGEKKLYRVGYVVI